MLLALYSFLQNKGQYKRFYKLISVRKLVHVLKLRDILRFNSKLAFYLYTLVKHINAVLSKVKT